MSIKKIAILGSAFNPPTKGHQSVILQLLHFDQIILLPSIAHVWNKKMLDYQQRCQMVSLFIEDLIVLQPELAGKITLSLIEDDLYKHKKEAITTYSVLAHYATLQPNDQLTFVIGPDNLLKFNKFFKYDQILKHWSILCCPEIVAIHSTMVRDALLENEQKAYQLITEKVAQYIINNNVYK